MSEESQPSAAPPLSIRPYTLDEIAGFEAFNEIKMPTELVTHLTKISRVMQRAEGRPMVVEIYAGEPHTENEDTVDRFTYSFGGGCTAILPADHALIRDGFAIADPGFLGMGRMSEARLFELQSRRAAERITANPPPFLKLVDKDESGASVLKILCIAQHGCGEEDWMSMSTGRIYLRDWDRVGGRWFSAEIGSLTEYLALPPGTRPADPNVAP